MLTKGDFHIHSTNSDGNFNVKELVDAYKKLNYDIIAITDHDTMDGCAEAIEYGKTQGIKVIPGVELSTRYNGDNIHILGFFNDKDCNRKEIIEYSKLRQQDKISGCVVMVRELKACFNIDFNVDELLEKNNLISMLDELNIPKEIIESGYKEKYIDILKKYLYKDSPLLLKNKLLTPQEIIDFLRSNNAVVILAHPVLIKNTKIEDLLDIFKFDGMEAIYALNTEQDTIYFTNVCKQRDLLITGGSDFHSYTTPNHGVIGDISLDYKNINNLIKVIAQTCVFKHE